jgi:ABC-type sugar transport system substrate-binding protein
MADLSYTISGSLNKGALQNTFSASGVTADLATAGMLAVTLELGTTTTQITTTTIGALGLCFARSLSTVTTHTVSIGRLAGTTLHDTVRLKAGEAAVLRLAPGDYAARAAVAGTRAVLTIYED